MMKNVGMMMKVLSMLVLVVYSMFCESFISIWLCVEGVNYIFLWILVSDLEKTSRVSLVYFVVVMGFSSLIMLFLMLGVDMGIFKNWDVCFLFFYASICLKFGMFPSNFWISSVVKNFNVFHLVLFNTVFKIPMLSFFNIVFKGFYHIFLLAYFLCMATLVLGYAFEDEKILISYASVGSTFILLYLYSVSMAYFLPFFLLYSLSLVGLFLSSSGVTKMFFISVFLGLPLGPYFMMKMFFFKLGSGMGEWFMSALVVCVLLSLPIYFRLLSIVSRDMDSEEFYLPSKMDFVLMYLTGVSGYIFFLVYIIYSV